MGTLPLFIGMMNKNKGTHGIDVYMKLYYFLLLFTLILHIY